MGYFVNFVIGKSNKLIMSFVFFRLEGKYHVWINTGNTLGVHVNKHSDSEVMMMGGSVIIDDDRDNAL